jgi:hypothetical protein
MSRGGRINFSARMSESATDYGYVNEKQPFQLLFPGSRGRVTNLPEWKVNSYSMLTSKHGQVASVIATSERVTPAIPSFKDSNGMPLPDNELLFRKKQIEYAAKKALDDAETERKLAADIFSLLSIESKTLVREARMEVLDDSGVPMDDDDGFPMYEDWDLIMNKDPLSIMRRIDKTHMTANTGNELNDRCYLIMAFSDMKQHKDESIGLFLDRFNNHVKIMKMNKCEVADEEQLVAFFIIKLRDDTYLEFKAACDNDYRRNHDFYPKTLMDAYNAALYFCPSIDKAARILVTAENHETGVSY